MKKWIKYSFAVMAVMILAGASWITYTFFLKDYETADKKVDEIVDSEFNIELPEGGNDGTSDNLTQEDKDEHSNQNPTNKEHEDNQNENINSTSTNQNEKDTQKSTKNSKSKQNSNEMTQTEQQNNQNSAKKNQSNDNNELKDTNSTETDEDIKDSSENKEVSNHDNENKVTVEDIKNRYRPSFNALQDQALAKLNNLVTYAYDEYKKKKKSGEDVSYGYFYRKYKSAAKELEANTDATFQRLYTSLQQELVKNGFSKKDAIDVKEYYNQKKDKRESQMITKVLEKF